MTQKEIDDEVATLLKATALWNLAASRLADAGVRIGVQVLSVHRENAREKRYMMVETVQGGI